MASQMPYSYVSSQHQQYLLAPHPQHSPHVPGHVHLVSTQMRPEQPQRKRPKYTRSKTGCLTCRGKKIKCDETKPKCQRCSHGQRECTWPEAVPPKKKPAARRSSAVQERPTTADSTSRISDSSSTSRDVTPNSHSNGRDYEGQYVSAPTTGSDRRYSEPQTHPYSVSSASMGRRQTLPQIGQSQLSSTLPSSISPPGDYAPPHPSHSPAMMSSYGNSYSSTGSTSSRSNSRPSTANSLPPTRFPGLDAQYSPPTSLLPSVEPREPYLARWETLPQVHRQDSNPYGYHSTSQENTLLSRDYTHDHGGRI